MRNLKTHIFPILGEQTAGAAGMDKEHIVIGLIITLSCPLYQSCEGLAGVAGIQHDALQLHHHGDGFVALPGGDGVAGAAHIHQIHRGQLHIRA